jgi:hypothetical protein
MAAQLSLRPGRLASVSARTRFGAALGARKTPAVSAVLGFGLVNGQGLNGVKPNEKRPGAVPVRQQVRCRAASASPIRA